MDNGETRVSYQTQMGFGERGWGLWVMRLAILVGTCGLVISSQVPEIVKNAWENLTIDSDLGLA